MEASNELNDIILNKHPKNDKTKKILLTIATFSIVLIIVVIAMNQFTNREKAALPHLPQVEAEVAEQQPIIHEPAYEVVKESAVDAEQDAQQQTAVVTEKLAAEPKAVEPKEEVEVAVFEEPKAVKEPVYEETIQPAAVKETPVDQTTKPAAKPAAPKVQKTAPKPKVVRPSGKYDPRTKRVVGAETLPKAQTGQYYIQVGSFARYAPSKAFLNKITDRGYTYSFHEVTKNGKTLNKVLIGPFKTQTAARQALPVIRKRVVEGAFLIKL